MEERYIERVGQFTDCTAISMDMSFKRDLLMDSLSFTKMIIDLEDFFGMEFEDDTYLIGDDIRLRDLFSILQDKIGESL